MTIHAWKKTSVGNAVEMKLKDVQIQEHVTMIPQQVVMMVHVSLRAVVVVLLHPHVTMTLLLLFPMEHVSSQMLQVTVLRYVTQMWTLTASVMLMTFLGLQMLLRVTTIWMLLKMTTLALSMTRVEFVAEMTRLVQAVQKQLLPTSMPMPAMWGSTPCQLP